MFVLYSLAETSFHRKMTHWTFVKMIKWWFISLAEEEHSWLNPSTRIYAVCSMLSTVEVMNPHAAWLHWISENEKIIWQKCLTNCILHKKNCTQFFRPLTHCRDAFWVCNAAWRAYKRTALTLKKSHSRRIHTFSSMAHQRHFISQRDFTPQTQWRRVLQHTSSSLKTSRDWVLILLQIKSNEFNPAAK